MFKRTLVVVLPFLLAPVLALAQAPPQKPACNPSFNGKVICTLPQIYGETGLTLANPNHNAHFVGSFQQGFAPLTLAVGTELSLLPFASPASGVIFQFDRSLGVVTRSTESYGPILAERAETIGRHRLYLAATYQFYDFSSIDGIDLNHIPAVYSHVEFPVAGVVPAFEHDFITTENRLDLKYHQVTFYATFGITDRIDVSAAVPILDVRFGVTSAAHIVRIAPPDPSNRLAEPITGQFHYFSAADPNGSIDASFTNHDTASGLGDVIFRVKGTVVKHERARVALGLDVRAPTGDELNFLGAGGTGIKPFLAASYGARISPHANIGFEYNGDSILAGNVQTGATAKLPNQFFYSFGVDAGINKKLTAAIDYLGQRVSSTVRVKEVPFVDEFGDAHPGVTQTVLTRDSLNLSDLALGLKYSPFGNFLVTGNVMVKLNDAGLRANVVPLVGISYTF